MATTSTKSTVIYKVHPLVPINISEHWTRAKGQAREGLADSTSNRAHSPALPTSSILGALCCTMKKQFFEPLHETKEIDNVFGVVMGVQNGREMEVHNSFPVPCQEREGKLFLDEEHYKERVEQYKTVFPELDALGWYCTGQDIGLSPLEGSLHSEFCKFIESPIVCRVITSSDFPPQKVPLVLLESSLNEPSKYESLRCVDWSLVSEESERIGVDHVTRHSQASSADKESCVSKQIRSTTAAAEMLHKRMIVIRAYLDAVEQGQIEGDPEILKEAKKILELLPLMESEDLEAHLNSEKTDVNCALLIPDMVKLCGSLQHLVDTIGVAAAEKYYKDPQPFKSKLSKVPGNASNRIFN